jgi:hypothetical protein
MHVRVLVRNLWHSNSLKIVESRRSTHINSQLENNWKVIDVLFRQHMSIKDIINTKDNYKNLEATQENLEIVQYKRDIA